MTLVIMAAGVGARFGGLKQIEPADSFGHILIDYSVYDAVRSGFDRVIFIIRRDIEAEFKKIIDLRISKWGIKVDYAFQELEDLPQGFIFPKERKKPWGTAQAVASLGSIVNSPFALINADDYYGRSSFENVAGFLLHNKDSFAMISYSLKNTLSKTGSVSRGICEVENNRLVGISETTGIRLCDGSVISDKGKVLDPDVRVSMNFWGFTPRIIEECKAGFSEFLEGLSDGESVKKEYYLTDVISKMIERDKVKIEVIDSSDIWYGVTNREDKTGLRVSLDALIRDGKYPEYF